MLKGERDVDLLVELAKFELGPVLVTYDNKLATQHPDLIRGQRITVAVISSTKLPPDLTQTQYLRDVVHRHAHRFVAQDLGTAWRYRTSLRRMPISLP
jgi:hypothetical protein